MEYHPLTQGFRTRYGNNRWLLISEKLQRNVHLNSELEYDYCLLIETDPDIESYCEQPLRVSVTNGRKILRTLFDFWEHGKTGERFVEVKYARDLDPMSPQKSLRSIKQVEVQREWCELNGYDYSVVTDEDVYAQPQLLTNKKRILTLTHEPVSDEHLQRLERMLKSSSGSVDVQDISHHLFPDLPFKALTLAAHALFRGIADAQLESSEFGLQTKIWYRAGHMY